MAFQDNPDLQRGILARQHFCATQRASSFRWGPWWLSLVPPDAVEGWWRRRCDCGHDRAYDVVFEGPRGSSQTVRNVEASFLRSPLDFDSVVAPQGQKAASDRTDPTDPLEPVPLELWFTRTPPSSGGGHRAWGGGIS